MELQKQNNNNIPTALLPILQREEVQLLASNRWSEVADLLPVRIEGTFDLPKVNELVLATSRDSVAAFIEFELVKLSALVSIGGNLSKSQVPFIASELIDLYPNETIADFKICFQRGARGDYGDIFRMDGIVIRKWMNAYLEEKYQILENKLMKEKDEYHAGWKNMQQPTKEETDKLLSDYLEKLDQERRGFKKVRPITDQEIKSEGQKDAPKPSYTPDASYFYEAKAKRYEFQEKTVRERHPDWSEDQIQARLKELRKNEV